MVHLLGDLRPDLGVGVDPDDDPADGADGPVDGRVQGHPRPVRPDPPEVPDPTDSTIWMGAVSIVFYVGLTLISANILADTIAAVGLMIAFYYGLTGFACAWFYRKTMRRATRQPACRACCRHSAA